MFRKILQFILKILSKLVLWKYKPIVVAVTGSVGKTSTKEAIYAVLKCRFEAGQIRRTQKNYNTEIGVPLTIFGLETGGKSIFAWANRFVKIFLMIIFRKKYPNILIIEMGADRPGDIEYLTKFVKPKVGIITAIGEIPVHVEFFKNPSELAREKKKLIDCLGQKGVAVLNYDDQIVKSMAQNIKSKVLTYGLEKGAEVWATNYELRTSSEENNFGEITFKLNYKGSAVPVKLRNILGRHQVYPALAAAAVGIIFNLNLVDISEGLRNLKFLPGRMKLIKGVKNTLIIDDSYNAAPLSTLAALDTLNNFSKEKSNRKIAVLGDMLEIGPYAPDVHKRVGRKVAEMADLLFVVGQRSKFISQGAQEKGMSKDKIFEFCNSDQAKKKVQQEIEQNDVILIKASRAMKMEKIVEEIMAQPQKADELLV